MNLDDLYRLDLTMDSVFWNFPGGFLAGMLGIQFLQNALSEITDWSHT